MMLNLIELRASNWLMEGEAKKLANSEVDSPAANNLTDSANPVSTVFYSVQSFKYMACHGETNDERSWLVERQGTAFPDDQPAIYEDVYGESDEYGYEPWQEDNFQIV